MKLILKKILKNMESKNKKLSKCELDIINLIIFISQSLENLNRKMCEYQHLQKDLYVQDYINKAQEYVNSLE